MQRFLNFMQASSRSVERSLIKSQNNINLVIFAINSNINNPNKCPQKLIIDEVRGSRGADSVVARRNSYAPPVVLRRGLSDQKTKKYDLSNQTRAFAIARLVLEWGNGGKWGTTPAGSNRRVSRPD